jgi:hypothetical protein
VTTATAATARPPKRRGTAPLIVDFTGNRAAVSVSPPPAGGTHVATAPPAIKGEVSITSLARKKLAIVVSCNATTRTTQQGQVLHHFSAFNTRGPRVGSLTRALDVGERKSHVRARALWEGKDTRVSIVGVLRMEGVGTRTSGFLLPVQILPRKRRPRIGDPPDCGGDATCLPTAACRPPIGFSYVTYSTRANKPTMVTSGKEHETAKRVITEDDAVVVRPGASASDSPVSRKRRASSRFSPSPDHTAPPPRRLGASAVSDETKSRFFDDDTVGDVEEHHDGQTEESDRRDAGDEVGPRCHDGVSDDDDDSNFDPASDSDPGPPCVLKLQYWMRSVECTTRKLAHITQIDAEFGYYGMEEHIEKTVFRSSEVIAVLERNMFPYECPNGISHHTLWSRKQMTRRELVKWCKREFNSNPTFENVTAWNFDMNNNNSVDVPHYHVFILEETTEENGAVNGQGETVGEDEADEEARGNDGERETRVVHANKRPRTRPKTPPGQVERR